MAKAGAPPKADRNKALIDLKNNTMLSFAELGNIVSISKQAAWAICKRAKGEYRYNG